MGLMMVAEVLEFTRTETEEGHHVTDVKCDPGDGDNFTATHTSPPGEDSHPLPGDQVVAVRRGASGEWVIVGYLDLVNAPQAAAGEKRFYSRDAAGAPQAVFWLKADGSAVVSNGSGSLTLAADGNLSATGNLRVAGNIEADGEVTAKSGTPTAVGVSTHTHPSGTGPTGAPTPGS